MLNIQKNSVTHVERIRRNLYPALFFCFIFIYNLAIIHKKFSLYKYRERTVILGITVEQICARFKDLKGYDLRKLVGSSNFSNNTVISLNNFASYSGKNATGIQTFVAKEEGNNFIELLSNNKQQQISRMAGIDNNSSNSFAQNNNTNKIPMGLSLFNIPKPQNV